MAVNFLTLRSAVANDMAVQHLTYSTMVGHPTASHQTVQAIVVSSIMTMGHVGIGTTTALSGTALNVVGSTMISGNTSIVGAATGTALVINNNQTGVSDAFSLMMTNKQTPPSRLMFIQKAIGTAAYNNIVQGGDHILLSYDQNSGVAGANGIVIGGWNQTAGLRIGTTSSAFNGDLTINGGLTGSEVYTNGWLRINGSGGVNWQTYGRGIYSADSAGASYGNVSVYGTGINTWNGYDINGRYTFMANGDTIGVHDRNHSWVWRNVNTVMYISKTLVLESVAQNSDYYSQVAVLNGTTLQKSQCMMRNIYFHNNVGWSGGVNMTYAFYRYNSICPLRISGKYSGFCGGNNMLQITIRIYSHAAGTHTYYYLNNFTNNGGNHHTVPLDHIVTDLPYTGWHDIYLYNSSGWSTDTNDQLTVNVQLLPVRDF